MKNTTDNLRAVGSSRLVRLWQWLTPRKEWMITWGCGFAHWKPRKELRWFWMGEPCTLMVDGCGPFAADKIDDALAAFHKPNTDYPEPLSR